MSSNEKDSKRHYALAEVLGRNPGRWDFKWKDPGIDLVIGGVGFEIKEREDMVSSMFTGHLGKQRIQAAKLGIPCGVAVMGTLDQMLDSVPEKGPNGWRNKEEIMRDRWRLIKGDAALVASNFAPNYLSSNHKLSMEILTARAYAIATEQTSLPAVKSKSIQHAMLSCLPRVGDEAASRMEAAGIKVKLAATIRKRTATGVTEEFKIIDDPNLLRIVPGIGMKTAMGIMEVLV